MAALELSLIIRGAFSSTVYLSIADNQRTRVQSRKFYLSIIKIMNSVVDKLIDVNAWYIKILTFCSIEGESLAEFEEQNWEDASWVRRLTGLKCQSENIHFVNAHFAAQNW